MKNIIFTIILSFLFSFSVTADIEKAMTAYQAGDYEQTFKILKPLAEEENVHAQFMLAKLYQKGEGVHQNIQETAKWLMRAANQEVDPNNKLSSLGISTSQYNLALMYKDGIGVEQSFRKAVNWYRSAAKLGDDDAQNNLGNMYAKGQGVRKNSVRAYMWYFIARKNGNPDAKANTYTLLIGDSEKTLAQKNREIKKAIKLADGCIENHYKNCN